MGFEIKKGIDFSIKKIFSLEFGVFVFIALLVVIGTFPDIDGIYSSGIDPSLVWLFNDLFENNISLGKHIIFPHGPLAFFTYPLPENIVLTNVTLALLKCLLIYNIYWIWEDEKKTRKLIIVGVVAYLCSMLLGFQTMILINILLLYCNYFNHKKNAFKYLAFCLTGFAFFLKAYIAIVTGVIFLSFIGYWVYQSKNVKIFLLDCFCLLAIMQMIWLLLYKSFAGFPTYILGMYHLAGDNSSAVSYYPYNNWWILSLFFLLFGAIFFINRTKKSLFYFVLIALGTFAAWKHGMAREDYSHTNGFFVYIICCLLTFSIFQRTKIYANIILSVAILSLISINREITNTNTPLNLNFFKGEIFLDFVMYLPEIKNDLNNFSKESIKNNKLPASIRETISNATVDVYPWDYSIIAANQLNLKPRVVIQSYAAYTSWLDAQNAEHFNSSDAPDFLIWEFHKMFDVNGGDMNSIDNRYLLNDEPQTILQILRHYDSFYSDEKFQIYKKRKAPIDVTSKIVAHASSKWSEWIEIPQVDKNILRAKLSFNKTGFQRLKSFLYKDEQFWIYLLLKNGEIHKYRIVPKNAEDGLWIMPYVYNSTTAYTVEKVLFKSSMEDRLADKLEIDWEAVKLVDSAEHVKDFFHFKKFTLDSLIINSTNSWERGAMKNWSMALAEQLANSSFDGERSFVLPPKSYSPSFTIQLDSLVHSNLKIAADCWVKAPDYTFKGKVYFILSVEDKNGNVSSRSISIDGQLIDENKWNNIFHSMDYKNEGHDRILKVYLYNEGEDELFLDSFRVMLFKKQ